jgi:hypothetical protein
MKEAIRFACLSIACCFLHASFLLGFFLNSEVGDDMLLEMSAEQLSTDHMALYPRGCNRTLNLSDKISESLLPCFCQHTNYMYISWYAYELAPMIRWLLPTYQKLDELSCSCHFILLHTAEDYLNKFV